MSRNTPLERRHMEQLRRQAALLVARIESDCAEIPDAGLRQRFEHTCTFAHDLLDKISLVEQVMIGQGEYREVLDRLQQRFDAGERRLQAIQQQLDRIDPTRADRQREQPPSSGGELGDAVRDSFLNLG